MKGLFDDNDDTFEFGELNTASDIFEKKEPEPEPIEFAWAWLAKYRVPYQDSKESFSGIYYHNLTHTGFYSPTGAGKTFLRNTIIEVSLWAHDQNIVISDRKLDSLGFLLPQDPSVMMNSSFFQNPRTGDFPIIPDCLPKDNFILWLPATNFSYYDPLIEELIQWGVVKFFRFHPRMFIESTMGDYIPYSVGMTQSESLATSRALMRMRGEIRTDEDKEKFTLEALNEYIEDQEQLHPMSKPYQKLIILQDSGIVSSDTSVELINRLTGEHLQQPVTTIRNFNDIVTKPKKQTTGNLHVFCNKYMSSSAIDNTLSTCINYLIFGGIRESCENIYNKKKVICHLPEAEYSLSAHSSENQNDKIRSFFGSAYANALRETRQYQLYHFLDTQQVSELPSNVTANQMTLWLLPGFKHKNELNWLQSGLGRAHLDYYSLQELLSMRDPFENRGKAFYIGADLAVKCWTRPRQTYHFKEGNNPTELLSSYRETFGLDNAQPWIRWDE